MPLGIYPFLIQKEKEVISIPTEVIKLGKIYKKISNTTSQVLHPETETSQLVDFPDKYNNSGKYLSTDGINLFWNTVSAGDSLPDQTGNSGKYLTTNGTTVSWAELGVTLPSQTGNAGKVLLTNGTTASWVSLNSIQEVFNVNSSTTSVTLESIPNNAESKYIAVYHDGLRLVDNIDYTYNSSTKSVSFSRSFLDGDQVVVYIGPIDFGTGESSSEGGSVEGLPSQTGNAGKFLTTNGTTLSWATVNALPSQTGNSGKFLTTNGTTASWDTIFSGDYTDLTNKPDLTLKANVADLATVATTGDYEDLTNLPDIPEIPDQANNAGKFLTTDGTDLSWSDILNEVKVSSVHYPTINTNTVVLTQAQALPSTISKYTMSVYRDGIYLNPSIDYGYNSSTRTFTFVKSFKADEVVTVLFAYLTTDSQSMLDLDVEEYEAGSGITFTNNAITNKTIISANDQLPTQTNNSGKYLTTNGSTLSWANVDEFPTQANNSGKFLTTNGTTVSWGTPTDTTYTQGTGITITGTTISANDQLPSRTGKSGQYLTTDGTNVSWGLAVVHPSEKCVLNNNASGTITLDIDDAVIYSLNMTGNSSIVISKDSTLDVYSTNRSATITLLIKNGGSYIINWPSNLNWADSIAPTLSINDKYDVITLITFDSGTTWLGLSTGSNYTLS